MRCCARAREALTTPRMDRPEEPGHPASSGSSTDPAHPSPPPPEPWPHIPNEPSDYSPNHPPEPTLPIPCSGLGHIQLFADHRLRNVVTHVDQRRLQGPPQPQARRIPLDALLVAQTCEQIGELGRGQSRGMECSVFFGLWFLVVSGCLFPAVQLVFGLVGGAVPQCRVESRMIIGQFDPRGNIFDGLFPCGGAPWAWARSFSRGGVEGLAPRH